MLAVTNTLSGTASLSAHNGAIAGINVEQLLRRLERRPLSGNGDFRSGRTPFDQLALTLKIEQGQVSVDEMHLSGPAVRLAVGGQVSVPTRDLDLKGVATLGRVKPPTNSTCLSWCRAHGTTRSCSPTRRA